MLHNGRSTEPRQSREKSGARNTTPDRDRTSKAFETGTHPILRLQQMVGNRAVQRALGHQPQATHIQRHVAPGTVALGQMLSASLLGHFGDLSLKSQDLQQAASDVSFTADGLLGDSTDLMVYQVSAETYGAGLGTQITPATSTTPTQMRFTEPLAITGSDS